MLYSWRRREEIEWRREDGGRNVSETGISYGIAGAPNFGDAKLSGERGSRKSVYIYAVCI